MTAAFIIAFLFQKVFKYVYVWLILPLNFWILFFLSVHATCNFLLMQMIYVALIVKMLNSLKFNYGKSFRF